jgi:hypothetical protein
MGYGRVRHEIINKWKKVPDLIEARDIEGISYRFYSEKRFAA